MSERLRGKRAVVTAAGQGIGQAIARAFIEQGAEVHASDIDMAALDKLACPTARLDVTSTAAVRDYAQAVGDIDVLVNVAGFVHDGTALDTTDEDWDFTFDINVKSMHRMIGAFLPGMLRRTVECRGTASIINMSSCASSLRGLPRRYAYGATKAAIIGLTKSVAADFITRRVRANAICAGPVRTPSWEARVDALTEALGDRQAAFDHYLSRQPTGRVGEPDEIAALAVYLASEESAFMTGIALPVDGGLTL